MFGGDGGGLSETFLQKQVGEERACGNSGHAALGLEADGHKMSIFDARREAQNVATNGIGGLGGGRRSIEFTGILGIFEVSEEGRGEHAGQYKGARGVVGNTINEARMRGNSFAFSCKVVDTRAVARLT